MCTVSNVTDGFFPYTPSYPSDLPWKYTRPLVPVKDAGIEEILEFIRNLEKARQYDEATGQPDCQDENKTKIINEVIARVEQLNKEQPSEELHKILMDLAVLRYIICQS